MDRFEGVRSHFGTGFVSSSENFGSQGEAPSHPVLLDWMAREFVRTGWDVKAMQKLIVTSAVYRQSSRATPELIERDPRNRLLARGSRFRIPAEMVRDNVLAVSGLLNKKMGGPSVYPYQPEGLWKEVAFGGDFTAQEYTPGSGEDLYRRSMYTVWKRSAPPPALVTFDAPDREKCVSLRSRTNTPLQALAMINDPTYVEAARALAGRMLEEGGRDPARRIRHGFRLATARVPNGGELSILLDAVRQHLRNYRKDKKAAAALMAVGESATNGKDDVDVSEMAYRMQTSVPELMDLSSEPESIFEMYGSDARKPGTYAANCLLARRLAERDVRFIQLYHRGWDQHNNLPRDITLQAKDTDQASAALILDLKQRGLLEDTLVIWGGEFGRTVYSQGKLTATNYGRDHHPRCFTMWAAGGGIRGGITLGKTDDFSYNIVEDPVHIHDLQATILHCLGIDHTKLTYKFQGRHFRLTDIHGNLVKKILA